METIKAWLAAIKVYLFIGFLAVLAVAWWWHGHQRYEAGKAVGDKEVAQLKAGYAQASLKAEAAARAREQASAQRMTVIDAQHQEDLQNAKANSDRIIAGLRAGNLKLRQRWTCTARVSAPAERAAQPDAGADDRAASAGRIIGAADEADAEIRALQAIVKADRAEQN